MDEITIRRWDPAEHLNDVQDAEAYLAAALDDGDSQLIEAVLDDIARAGIGGLLQERGSAASCSPHS